MKLTRLQGELAGALVGLARAHDGIEISPSAAEVLQNGLTALFNADDSRLEIITNAVRAEKHRTVPDCASCKNPCGRTADFDTEDLDLLPLPLKKAKLRLLEAAVMYAESINIGANEYVGAANKICDALFAFGYEWFSEQEIDKKAATLRDLAQKID